jgi:hypothetical protein
MENDYLAYLSETNGEKFVQEVQKQFNAEYLRMVIETNPNQLEVGNSKVIVPLVKAVQELSAQVEYLTNKLNNITGA